MDRAFVLLSIDGQLETLQIPYNPKDLGIELTKKLKKYRQKIINAFWRKQQIEPNGSKKLKLEIWLDDEKNIVDDEDKTFTIEILVNGRAGLEIERELIQKVVTTTNEMMYVLSYMIILSEDYREQI